MVSRRKVVIKEREVKTCAELWLTSKCLLEKGQDDEKGSPHQFRASLVFTAFALEAYLNHIGPEVFQTWDPIERCGPRDKLDIIAEKLGFIIDYSQRPWSIMTDLFYFRNKIAHGKTYNLPPERRIRPITYQDDPESTFAKDRWEKYCTRQNAEQGRVDVDKIAMFLHEKSGSTGQYPFDHGMQITSETLE